MKDSKDHVVASSNVADIEDVHLDAVCELQGCSGPSSAINPLGAATLDLWRGCKHHMTWARLRFTVFGSL